MQNLGGQDANQGMPLPPPNLNPPNPPGIPLAAMQPPTTVMQPTATVTTTAAAMHTAATDTDHHARDSHTTTLAGGTDSDVATIPNDVNVTHTNMTQAGGDHVDTAGTFTQTPDLTISLTINNCPTHATPNGRTNADWNTLSLWEHL